MGKNGPRRKAFQVITLSQGRRQKCKQGAIRRRTAGSEGWVYAARNKLNQLLAGKRYPIHASFKEKKPRGVQFPPLRAQVLRPKGKKTGHLQPPEPICDPGCICARPAPFLRLCLLIAPALAAA